jgi:hypothetical protein
MKPAIYEYTTLNRFFLRKPRICLPSEHKKAHFLKGQGMGNEEVLKVR